MIAIGHPVVKFNRIRGLERVYQTTYIHKYKYIDTSYSIVSELEIVLRSESSYVRC